MRQVFTTGQVSKICKVAPRTVSKWFDCGKLIGYRIPLSQDRRIPREKLIKFLRENNMPLGELEEEEFYRILLVGFSDPLQRNVVAGLTAEKVRVKTCPGAFAMGQLIHTLTPNLILIDFAVGRQEAIALRRNVNESAITINPTTIAVVGEDESQPESYKQFGFNEVLKQPVSSECIAALVATYIAEWKAVNS